MHIVRSILEVRWKNIISKEIYAKAQEIRERRAENRTTVYSKGDKREKYSRKYAFSCMMRCGYCGGTITRRSWHGGTSHRHKEVMSDFLDKMQKGLDADSVGKKIDKIEKDIEKLQTKKVKLIDMRLEELIDKDSYEHIYSSIIDSIERKVEDVEKNEVDGNDFKKTLEIWVKNFIPMLVTTIKICIQMLLTIHVECTCLLKRK